MGDRDHGPLILFEVLLQPAHRLRVEVVGGLIQKQEVRLLQQGPGQGHASLFAAGEVLDGRVARGGPDGPHEDLGHPVQLPAIAGLDLVQKPALLGDQAIHLVGILDLAEALRDLLVTRQQGHDVGGSLAHVLQDRQVGIQLRFLGDVPDGDAGGGLGMTLEVAVFGGHDPQERALAGAVGTQDADLGAGKEGQGDVLEDLFLAVHLVQVVHGEDVLIGHEPALRHLQEWPCPPRGGRQDWKKVSEPGWNTSFGMEGDRAGISSG